MRKVIVNFSGGKDSTVAILEALKVYPKDEIMLCYQDTGAEYLETDSHTKLIASILDLPLVTIKPNRDFWQEVQFRGYFPTPDCRSCTEMLKIHTFQKWFNSVKYGYDEIIVVFGKRAEESLARRKLTEWHTDKYLTTKAIEPKIWNPCLEMTEKEVYARIEAEGLPLHPCYEFSRRCSCWCCIFQHPNVVRTYAEMHPDLYEKACLVEDEIKHKWKEHFAINDLMKQGRLI